nr:T9SS type A sorting domain-containing protein [candidate division Zixibacteria bacterium]
MKTFMKKIVSFTAMMALAAIIILGFANAEATITMTSVTLHFTAPGDDGNSGQATEYDIRYSLSPINESNWDQAVQAAGEPIPSVCGCIDSFYVEGLNPGTTYYFAIKAADEVPNWSPLSNIYEATTLTMSLDVDEDGDLIPTEFNLAQNYPNPFNPVTQIEYSVPSNSHVKISVYNTLGQLTRVLVDGVKSAGVYTVTWDGTNNAGHHVASGIYLYRIEAGPYNHTRKMAIIQ